ncbi:MAG: IS256 family transposase [Chloroflexi bacterium]|jgi:transposase-like protein|nr:IS256 family transposase [Chloroflexota bacterium]
MCNDTTFSEALRDEIHLSLDELARRGAQRMLAAALQAEVDEYIQRHGSEQDENNHALVVRNGRSRERTIQCGAGELKIQAPRVHDKRPGYKFSSSILPPYMRKSPRMEEAVPILYLRGLSTGDFGPALSALLGEEALAGFSSTTVTRLLTVWQDEYKAWRKRSLTGKNYVYLWADGVHFNVRLEADRLACLTLIGVLPDGSKEVVALEDGYRESTESWKTLLRDLKRRGMPAPKLAIADGALGFWAALREIYPEAEEQRCWVHKIANVLDKLPKRLQPRAKSHLHEIMRAEGRQTALEELARFQEEYEAKYPKAVDCLTKDIDTLFTFMDYPAAHWLHLRTTNAIESTFATVKARTRTTKGAGSRDAGLAMAFKLLTQAEKRWRRVNSPHLVALVAADVKFPDGETRILPSLPSDSVVNLQVDVALESAIHNI